MVGEYVWERPNGRDKPVERVEPYEDWEQEMREQEGTTTANIWKPVLVEILPGSDRSFSHNALTAAQYLWNIATNDPRMLQFDDLFPETLISLIDLERSAKETSRFTRFFIYLPEGTAYGTLQGLEAQGIARAVHVGVGMPEEQFTFADIFKDIGPILEADLSRVREKVGRFPIPGLEDLFNAYSVIRRRLAPVVATGVIDDVTGVANTRFWRPDATHPVQRRCRIEKYWQQAPVLRKNDDSDDHTVIFGQEFDRSELEGLMADQAARDHDENAFYRDLYGPAGVRVMGGRNLTDPDFVRPFDFRATHGSFVTDIAAGEPFGPDGEERPILLVQVPQLASAETWGGRLEYFLLIGLMRILHWADDWNIGGVSYRIAVVVNISYGVFAGPKNGTGFLESEIGRIVSARNKEGPPESLVETGVATAVVLPSGNGFRARTRGKMSLSEGDEDSIDWRLQPDDQSSSFIEIWIKDLEQAKLTVALPDGTSAHLELQGKADAAQQAPGAAIVPAARRDLVRRRSNGKLTVGRAYVQYPEGSDMTRVVLALAPTSNMTLPPLSVPPGRWRLTLRCLTSALAAHFEVQRDDTPTNFPRYGRQSYLDHPSVDKVDPATGRRDMPDPGALNVTRAGTLSSYVNGLNQDHVYVIGGAFARDLVAPPDGDITGNLVACLYAGAGPTGGRRAPDCAAVTDETRAHPARLHAGTFSGSAGAFSGTSSAAPLATRELVTSILAGGHGTGSGGFPQHSKGAGLAALKVGSIPVPGPNPDPQLGGVVMGFGGSAAKPRREFPK